MDSKESPTIKEQIQNLAKRIDNSIQKKFGNDFFQSIEHFFHNVSINNPFTLDWAETESEYTLSAKIAGIKKEDITLELTGNKLKIFYQTDDPQKKHDKSFTFHSPIDEDNVRANYQDGLLIVKIPKSKKSKTIDIE